MTRRTAIATGAGAAGLLAVGGYGLSRSGTSSSGSMTKSTFAGASGDADITLRAAAGKVDLGSRTVSTWSYDGVLPGREIRLKEGERTRIRVVNNLPTDTTVHWHGIRLANPMDGVPDATQKPIAPGGSFLYDFTPPDAGTYLYHSHVGTQLDRGLYGPLVVEAKNESLSYDEDVVLMLDDWLDGIGGATPDTQLADLRKNGMSGAGGMGDMNSGEGMGGMGGMGSGSGMMESSSSSAALGGMIPGRYTMLGGKRGNVSTLSGLGNAMTGGMMDVGDIQYPEYLINGRTAAAPFEVAARRGAMLRLRLVNVAADTIFTVFVDGAPVTIVAADGQRVEPRRVAGIVIGQGERYDVLVPMGAELGRVIAVPLGKTGRAVAVLRPAGSKTPVPSPSAPVTLPIQIAAYSELTSLQARPTQTPDIVQRLDLGFRSEYTWTLGGTTADKGAVMRFDHGQRVRFLMRNRTMMPHPMHLHGHSFWPTVGGSPAPLKDTVIVAPMQEVAIDWTADNLGTWMIHCHNAYHAEAGMMRAIVVA